MSSLEHVSNQYGSTDLKGPSCNVERHRNDLLNMEFILRKISGWCYLIMHSDSVEVY